MQGRLRSDVLVGEGKQGENESKGRRDMASGMCVYMCVWFNLVHRQTERSLHHIGTYKTWAYDGSRNTVVE
jgi:hypothetical protein